MTPMLSFLEPSRLWLLLLIPALAGLYLGLVRRRRTRRAVIERSMFDLLIPRDRTWLRHVAVALSILSLATLTLAFAKPKAEVAVPVERATIVVTIDVSLSMEAQDVEPSRLAAAKLAAADFVAALPEQFNVSLVSFSQSPTVIVPPTQDHGAVSQAIGALQPEQGTAIGEGIYASLTAAAQVPAAGDAAPAPARIVLLSDGKTQIGRSSSDAAAEARAQGIPVYTIAYGTDGGYIEISGRREPVPVDRTELRRIASISGGESYRAESAGQLKEVYADIGSSIGTVKVQREVTSRYAGAGLLLALLASAGLASLAARWP